MFCGQNAEYRMLEEAEKSPLSFKQIKGSGSDMTLSKRYDVCCLLGYDIVWSGT
jgi:hypothetical protein